MLQHINDLSHHIELLWTLSKAEGIYHQLMSIESQLPDNIRLIIGLEPLHRSPVTSVTTSDIDDDVDVSATSGNQNGNSSNNSHVPHQETNTSNNSDGSIRIGNDEVSFERGLNLSYM